MVKNSIQSYRQRHMSKAIQPWNDWQVVNIALRHPAPPPRRSYYTLLRLSAKSIYLPLLLCLSLHLYIVSDSHYHHLNPSPSHIMSFAPPSGPPPPSVPEGWKAQYDERYHAWYVAPQPVTSNILTISQVLYRPRNRKITMGTT